MSPRLSGQKSTEDNLSSPRQFAQTHRASSAPAKLLFLDGLASLAPIPVSRLVGNSVGQTFRFPLYRSRRTVPERPWTTGCDIFSESYDQQLSDFDLFLQSVSGYLGKQKNKEKLQEEEKQTI